MKNWRKKQLNGLAYVEAGAGPVMVMCHGGAGSHMHWVRNIDPLAEHFTVRAVDMPGYGESDAVRPDVSIEEYLPMAIAKIDAVAASETPIHLVGFSFGATFSAALAAALGPRIQKLTLCGPGGFGNPKKRILDMRRLPEGDLSDPAVREVLRHNLLQMMLHDPANIDETVMAMQLANSRRTEFDSRKLSFMNRVLADVGRMTADLQVIWGTEDKLAYPSPATRTEILRGKRPDLRAHFLPDCGHWVQFEGATEVNRHILEFHMG